MCGARRAHHHGGFCMTAGHTMVARAWACSAWSIVMVVLLLPMQASSSTDTIDPVSYLKAQVNAPDYSVADVWAKHQHLSNWAEVKRAAADTWDELPQAYDSQFKNPCWKTKDNKLRCLPYFQILGVSKCGTTDLYHRLTLHPDFVDCKWKGPHFWDESHYPRRKPRAPGKYDGSFPAYLGIFDGPAQEIAQDPGRRITGEASSNTYTAVAAYLRGPVVAKRLANGTSLAHYLYEAVPWSRWIVLMRDPVSRYYSAYYYYRMSRTGKGTPEDFHARAQRDITDWNTCVAERGEHRCLTGYQPQQLIKGMYSLYLPYWLEVWHRSRLLLMRTEDYKAAPEQHVQAAMDFLGLRHLDANEMGTVVEAKKRNTKVYDRMLNETRTLLQDFYRPYNQRLSQLMGGDARWLWGY